MSNKDPYTVLFDDPSLLVVDKIAGIPVISERSKNMIPGLYDRLTMIFGEDLRLVHRIDKQTSGLVIFAKSLEVQQYMTELFSNREIDKYYLAVVDGILDNAQWHEIDAPIFIRPNAMMASIQKKGRKAVTLYRSLETFGSASLVELKILTGRTHQIRLHMQHIGHPLMVDHLYGKREELYLSNIKTRKFRLKKGDIELPLISRLTLHASRVLFKHPASGTMVDIEAPLPKDLNALIRQLRKK